MCAPLRGFTRQTCARVCMHVLACSCRSTGGRAARRCVCTDALCVLSLRLRAACLGMAGCVGPPQCTWAGSVLGLLSSACTTHFMHLFGEARGKPPTPSCCSPHTGPSLLASSLTQCFPLRSWLVGTRRDSSKELLPFLVNIFGGLETDLGGPISSFR